MKRFLKKIYLPLPDYKARLSIFKNSFIKITNDIKEKDFEVFAQMTEKFSFFSLSLIIKTNRYSGADLVHMIREVLMKPVKLIMNGKYFEEKNDPITGKVKYKLD